MKKMFVAIFVVLVSSQAFAKEPSLVCRSQQDPNGVTLTLKASSFGVREGVQNLFGVTAEFAFSGKELEVGKLPALAADTRYKPTKYKNHFRFKLEELSDMQTGDKSYLPADMCSIKVMIPETAFEGGTFEAPVTYNCDQSGGKLILDCAATARK